MRAGLFLPMAAAVLSGALLSTAFAAAPGTDTAQVARGAVRTGNNQGKPFAVVDKKNAQLSMYDANGEWIATTPVLLGLARGDTSVPGIGNRPMAQIKPYERTTPAGRFMSEPGRNTGGEDIVWIDYDAAVSMHRVRATNKAERRLERLASPSAADNRISYGCINVPMAFYDAYVKPTLGSGIGVVYVLPEKSQAGEHFSFLHSDAQE